MPPVGFEPTISAGEWPQTYALDRAATGTGVYSALRNENDGRKQQYSEGNTAHWHLVHHKAHVDWPGIEPCPLQ